MGRIIWYRADNTVMAVERVEKIWTIARKFPNAVKTGMTLLGRKHET